MDTLSQTRVTCLNMPQFFFFRKKTKPSNKLCSQIPGLEFPFEVFHLPVKATRGKKDKVFPASHIHKFNHARKVSKLAIQK